jgi:hypothetical protein
MAPSATIDYEHNLSPRPLKRARKGSISTSKPPAESEEHHFVNNPQVDHIFIADGVASKKPGGKKVRLDLYPKFYSP